MALVQGNMKIIFKIAWINHMQNIVALQYMWLGCWGDVAYYNITVEPPLTDTSYNRQPLYNRYICPNCIQLCINWALYKGHLLMLVPKYLLYYRGSTICSGTSLMGTLYNEQPLYKGQHTTYKCIQINLYINKSI